MRVLGLDPGLTRAGYGVVDGSGGRMMAVVHGAIECPPGPVAGRLLALHERIRDLIASHQPDAVAVERVLFNANTKTAMSVGQAAGVTLLAAAESQREVAEYAPNEVKLAVAGSGGADKRQVQHMVVRLLDLDAPPDTPDAADALGLAITHLRLATRRKMEAAGA